MKIFFLTGMLFFLVGTHLYAQPNTKLQNMDYRNWYEKAARENDSMEGDVNYSMLPYYPKSTHLNFDSILNVNFELRHPGKSFLARTFRSGNMFEYDNPGRNVIFTLNPLLDLNVGKESGNTVYQNIRGAQVDVTIGDKITISSSIYESVSKLPSYVRVYADSLSVLPGMGRSRMQSGNSYNYSLPLAYIGYRPNKTFYFELGNDKNFIGSGYRSLLLSDFAYSYPYFKIVTDLGKIKYTNLWAQFVDAGDRDNWNKFNDKKKYGVFNYLTYTGVKKLQVSLFQSIIWTNQDSLGKRDINWAYFVPVIYLNTVNFNTGSPDNNVLGMDVNYQIKKHTVVYGQLIIDDFNISKFFKSGKFSGYFQEKYGIQLGAKFFDAFRIKDLFLQTEFNTVRPYVYDQKVPAINYTHYNEALAHPLGANFRELIVKGSYRMKRWFVTGELLVARYGSDTANSHWGRNIYENEYDAQMGINSYDNRTGQGVKTDLTYATIGLNYLMNPMTNSRFTFQFTHRRENIAGLGNGINFFTVGFSTNLINTYRDF
jgi:hypothetical protein